MKEKNDALELLDRLKEELGSRGLFSKKPDLALCSDICERLSRILPESFNEAEYVKQKRKEILSNADVVAKNTIRAAEEKAEKLASETDIQRRAQENAKRIIENAYAKSDELMSKTKAHLDNMFSETEKFLLSTLAVVRTNREELRNAMTDDDDE